MDQLSPRQVQVLEAMADGLGAHLIARRLGLAVPTVKTHIAAVFNKFGVGDRAAAVHAGHRLGYLGTAAAVVQGKCPPCRETRAA